MSRAAAVILSLLLAFAPAIAVAGSGCACLAAGGGEPEAATAPDACCGPASGELAPDPAEPDRSESDPAEPEPATPERDRPCEGQECSLVCCGTVKHVAASHRALAAVIDEPRAVSTPTPETRRGAPHVLELKRPPRPDLRA